LATSRPKTADNKNLKVMHKRSFYLKSKAATTVEQKGQIIMVKSTPKSRFGLNKADNDETESNIGILLKFSFF